MKKFSAVSEWVNKGAMSTGLSLFGTSRVARETAKAIAIKCKKYNSYGNPYDGMAWVPKSQCQKVSDDFYDSTKGENAWLIPQWLINKKEDEGCYVYD